MAKGIKTLYMSKSSQKDSTVICMTVKLILRVLGLSFKGMLRGLKSP